MQKQENYNIKSYFYTIQGVYRYTGISRRGKEHLHSRTYELP